MLKEERQQMILDKLNETTFVSVTELEKLLYISQPTVRRDLKELEKKGMIIRNHGGAMKLEKGAYQIPLAFRNHHKLSEKHDLCRHAASLIRNGDVIFIDASTSVLHIADYITAKDVTAVTNGMPCAMLLTQKGIRTFVTGGEIAENSLGCVGRAAEQFITNFNFNLTFFSCYGVNDKGMIVDTSLAETELRRAVFYNTQKKVFLYTADKKNLSAPYNLIPLSEIEVVISDEEAF